MLFETKRPVPSEQQKAWERFWEALNPLLRSRYPRRGEDSPAGPTAEVVRMEVLIWRVKFAGRWTPQQIDRLRELLEEMLKPEPVALAA